MPEPTIRTFSCGAGVQSTEARSDHRDLYLDVERRTAERDEARAEVERLRGRTHEIQAQEMARRAALDSEIAMWRRRWDLARQWSEEAELKAAWAADPTRAWWSMTSERDRAVLMRLVAEASRSAPEAADDELERYHLVLSALLRGMARRLGALRRDYNLNSVDPWENPDYCANATPANPCAPALRESGLCVECLHKERARAVLALVSPAPARLDEETAREQEEARRG